MRDVRELLSHPNVVEVLDALSGRPMTVADMRANIPSGRRALAAALRILAAHGLVTKSAGGSWDSIVPRNRVYGLTDRGRALVKTLSRLSVWTQMLEVAEAPDLHS